MKTAEFIKLTEREKENLLYKSGVYIGKRKTLDHSIILFQLEGFYVEVFYSKYRHQVAYMHISSDPEILDPYLQQLDVEELIST
jgi:hypothetical protein